MPDLSAELIEKISKLICVSHDAESGIRWLASSGRQRAGSPAGSMRDDGYWRVTICGRRYFVHCLVYALTHGLIPDGYEIDHIDLNVSNNAISNLRAVSKSQNQWNKRRNAEKSSGLPKNISIHGKGYQVQIKKFGISHNFWADNIPECVAWAEQKRNELHGIYGRHA